MIPPFLYSVLEFLFNLLFSAVKLQQIFFLKDGLIGAYLKRVKPLFT